MRNFIVICIIIIFTLVGLHLVHINTRPHSKFNPVDVSIASNLTNPGGNVLWINLEGLRTDHIGAYGYDNTTTPYIDSLAGESLVFERCYAQSSDSYRTLATMLTSEYPVFYPGTKKQHVGMGFRDLMRSTRQSLVAEIRNSGHTTTAIVSSRILKSEFGFDKGFDYYDDNMTSDNNGSLRIRNPEETLQAAESWLSRNYRRPFFMYVHFPDPAGPYDAPRNFAERLQNPPEYFDTRKLPVSITEKRPHNQIPAYHNIKGDPPNIGEMIRQYDAEIAEVDKYIGDLIYLLSRYDLHNQTMVVISSAHGESLGEHGYYFGHGGSVYHCLTNIPLIVYMPDSDAARIKDVVEGIDIMPTIMGYLGINTPEYIEGTNLLRFFTRKSLKEEYPAFAYWDDPNVYSVIKGEYELINFGNREYRLYDVIKDPDEIYDLYSEHNPVVDEMIQLMGEWMSENHKRALEIDIERAHNPAFKKIPMTTPQ